mmetsp:Transcript_26703/g.37161  ORF Transcript_26703/g.37161 Transcript_26703/m.37161 type:complete len:240 (-) Transcript_26703:28-747(-)
MSLEAMVLTHSITLSRFGLSLIYPLSARLYSNSVSWFPDLSPKSLSRRRSSSLPIPFKAGKNARARNVKWLGRHLASSIRWNQYIHRVEQSRIPCFTSSSPSTDFTSDILSKCLFPLDLYPLEPSLAIRSLNFCSSSFFLTRNSFSFLWYPIKIMLKTGVSGGGSPLSNSSSNICSAFSIAPARQNCIITIAHTRRSGLYPRSSIFRIHLSGSVLPASHSALNISVYVIRFGSIPLASK